MSDFRILHISDLHLSSWANHKNPTDAAKTNFEFLKSAVSHLSEQGGILKEVWYPSTYRHEIATELVRFIEQNSNSIDMILATGDIATTGLPEDLQAAYDFFTGTLQGQEANIFPSLIDLKDETGFSLLTIPGNHDRYNGKLFQPGNKDYEKIFGENWDFNSNISKTLPFLFECQTKNRIRYSLHRKQGKYLAIIKIDFSIKKARMPRVDFHKYLGKGEVYKDVIKELRNFIRHLKHISATNKTPIGIILASHFPPKFPNGRDALALENEQLLVDLALSEKIKIILSGHQHKSGFYSINDQLTVYCCGSTISCGEDDDNSFFVLTIGVNDSGDVSVKNARNLVWNEGADTNILRFKDRGLRKIK